MNNAEESVTFAIVWCDETLFSVNSMKCFWRAKKTLRNENRFFRVDTNDGEARKRKKEETKRDIELEKSAESVSFCVINTSAEWIQNYTSVMQIPRASVLLVCYVKLL